LLLVSRRRLDPPSLQVCHHLDKNLPEDVVSEQQQQQQQTHAGRQIE
jgi:urease alpha subunit